MVVKFRKAKSIDVHTIAVLHAKSWQENYRGIFSDDFLDKEVINDRIMVWKERFQKPSSKQMTWVAETDDTVIGFLCAYYNESTLYGTLLDNLHISSDFQGNGIAPQLISILVDECSDIDENGSFYLWVLKQNSGAIRFYERINGVQNEIVEGNDIGDMPIIKIRYVWSNAQSLKNGISKLPQGKPTRY